MHLVLIEVLFQFWQALGQDPIMVRQKAHQLRKPDNVETMHSVPRIGKQHIQRPKCVFLVEVHQKHSRHRRHALAVANLRIIHTVRGQYPKQTSLFHVITLTVEDMVTKLTVYVKIDLPDIGAALACQCQHLFVHGSLLGSFDLINLQQLLPNGGPHSIRDTFHNASLEVFLRTRTVP
uniref:Putative secreted protein n=1 Tax=Anopheles triannulatus TaxID=58253 RepID=A0A2M4B4S1_9DIPT